MIPRPSGWKKGWEDGDERRDLAELLCLSPPAECLRADIDSVALPLKKLRGELLGKRASRCTCLCLPFSVE